VSVPKEAKAAATLAPPRLGAKSCVLRQAETDHFLDPLSTR
jgi:hypothetical protein